MRLILKYNLLLFLTFLVVTGSCNEQITYKNKKEVVLDNNIGTVIIDLNPSFDLYQKAFGQSDCGCCCYSKNYQFFNSEVHEGPILDTIPYFSSVKNLHLLKYFMFNISHPLCRDCFNDGHRIYDEAHKNHIARFKNENINSVILVDTMIIINDRTYSIIGNRNENDSTVTEQIEAYTIVGNENITFFGQRRSNDTSDFVGLVFDMIKTIKIEE